MDSISLRLIVPTPCWCPGVRRAADALHVGATLSCVRVLGEGELPTAAAVERVLELAPVAVAEEPADVGRWGAFSVYNYRLFFIGSGTSLSGYWMLRAAQAWLVLDLTGSAAALGVLAIFQFLPITILTLFAGVVIDRVSTRWLMVATQLLAGAQALVTAVLILTNQIQYWEVLAMAAVLGLANAFDQPARSVFANQLVGTSRLSNAIALNSSATNGARIIGPGIGGWMIAIWGTGACFLFRGVACVGAVVCLLLLHGDELYPKRQAGRGAMAGQLADGLKYSFSTPSLGFLIVLVAFLGTFAYNWTLVLPLLTRYALDGTPEEFGAMNMALGVGSVLGSVLLATRLKPTPRLVVLAGTALSILLFLDGLVPSIAVALPLLVVNGMVSIAYSATTNTLLQLEARDEFRGRVLSVFTLMMAGSGPVGGTLLGIWADHWNIRVALGIDCALCLFGVVVACTYLAVARRRQAAAQLMPII